MTSIKLALCVLLVGLLCTPAAGSAQAAPGQVPLGTTPPTAAVAPQISADSNKAGTISLDVLVTDKSGAPVAGLQPGDFKLFDKKQAQSIVSVQAVHGANAPDDPPVQAILVVDAVNASIMTVSSERQLLSGFLEENAGELALPTSLAVLTDQGMKVHNPPSRDGKALEEFLNANTSDLHKITRQDGWWGDMDREQLSLKALNFLTVQASAQPGRKLFIWLSPGWRLQTGGQWVANQKDQQALYNNVASLSNALRSARITVYSIDPSGTDTELTFQQIYESFLKGVDSPKHVDYGYLLLQVLAAQTGGQALSAFNDMPALIGKCVGEVKEYYVLTYNPPAAAQPGEYHSIEVRVDKPGVKVRTRTGYYTAPANPAK